ncbi:MAG: hypothetical protein IPM57_08290 [Oligoflexia bacterium]|nr:hypothetical protein [Oligoflexia bacterium]
MKVDKQPNGLISVELTGILNGDGQLPKLDLKGAKTIVFNFDKIEAINSIGVKQWIAYLQEIPRSITIKFSHCRRVCVDQMNMVTNFKPSYVTIESFYVPYVCSKCVNMISVLYERGKNFDKTSKVTHPNQVLCGTCVAPAAIDAIEAKYFHFLDKR